jgi:hypothetical protein
MDRHVRQAAQLALQHRVGAQLRVELDQRHVRHDAGQVDRRFDAGVAAADHRHALALEQRAVAVRAVGHALVAVLGSPGTLMLRQRAPVDRTPCGFSDRAVFQLTSISRLRPGFISFRRAAGS